MNIYKEIPPKEFPKLTKEIITYNNEEIISLSENGFICEPWYYKHNIKNSLNDCYARKTVIEKLKIAQSFLPKGIYIKVYDAYRPVDVQKSLWNFYRNEIRKDYPNLSELEIDEKTSFFVSKPSYNELTPSLHNTGGAIDLTLIDETGKELNMGTIFDDFNEKTWTNYYEKKDNQEEIKNNRRILYNSMINAGFTNLPSEWWHYDYGNNAWSYFTNKNPLYKGTINFNPR